jgi:hypothetical protein
MVVTQIAVSDGYKNKKPRRRPKSKEVAAINRTKGHGSQCKNPHWY